MRIAQTLQSDTCWFFVRMMTEMKVNVGEGGGKVHLAGNKRNVSFIINGLCFDICIMNGLFANSHAPPKKRFSRTFSARPHFVDSNLRGNRRERFRKRASYFCYQRQTPKLPK